MDAEMEKVFAGPDRDKDKFDVLQLTSGAEGKSQHVASKFQDHDVDGMRSFHSIFLLHRDVDDYCNTESIVSPLFM